MNREHSLQAILDRREPWDLAVVGGGATGLGIALDAAARGYSIVLLEQSDFGKGTSSRSTKLVHGGVRYLQQGNLSLVAGALNERGLLFRNAPHLVRKLDFIVPAYRLWDKAFYGIGLKFYDLLAGKNGLGKSALISKDEILQRIPTLERRRLRGGVLYCDGQFDDSRLLVNLAQTAVEHGACVLNYAPVERLEKTGSRRLSGLTFRDDESGLEHAIKARCVINATGAFSDAFRQKDDPGIQPMIVPSQGAHIVLPHSFLPSDAAIMVPRTRDGRVMFAIPWRGHTLVGTTDTPVRDVPLEPRALPSEIDFILETAGGYLSRKPSRADILSVFTGVRPLVKRRSANTASLSRDHTLIVSSSGMLSVLGGKWTTYRRMAEDAVDRGARLAGLDKRPCPTTLLPVHGARGRGRVEGPLAWYGSDAAEIEQLRSADPKLGVRLNEALPVLAAEVVWAVRQEMARTLEDVLARRTRALFLNARVAMAMAPEAARLLARELGRNDAWQQRQLAEFKSVAEGFLV